MSVQCANTICQIDLKELFPAEDAGLIITFENSNYEGELPILRVLRSDRCMVPDRTFLL